MGVKRLSGGRFTAEAQLCGQRNKLGCFSSAKEAAEAYDACLRAAGVTSRLNFPGPGEWAAAKRHKAAPTASKPQPAKTQALPPQTQPQPLPTQAQAQPPQRSRVAEEVLGVGVTRNGLGFAARGPSRAGGCHIGTFPTASAAARAYDHAMRAAGGKCVNYPREGETQAVRRKMGERVKRGGAAGAGGAGAAAGGSHPTSHSAPFLPPPPPHPPTGPQKPPQPAAPPAPAQQPPLRLPAPAAAAVVKGIAPPLRQPKTPLAPLAPAAAPAAPTVVLLPVAPLSVAPADSEADAGVAASSARADRKAGRKALRRWLRSVSPPLSDVVSICLVAKREGVSVDHFRALARLPPATPEVERTSAWGGLFDVLGIERGGDRVTLRAASLSL